jgi:hypothetical protein
MPNPHAVIVFPPPMDRIARSYPAPHFLSSYINHHGLRAEPLDLNLAVLTALASPQSVRTALDAAVGQKNTLEGKGSLSRREQQEYNSCLRSISRLQFAIGNRWRLTSAEDHMRMEANGVRYTRIFFDLYKEAFGLFYDVGVPELEAVRHMINRPESLNLKQLVKEHISRALTDRKVPVVGFSVPFAQQFIPALVLAQEVKDQLPNVHICVGGPVITLLSNDYLKSLLDFLPIDRFVKYEGEKFLLDFIRSTLNGAPVEKRADRIVEPFMVDANGARSPKNRLAHRTNGHLRLHTDFTQRLPENSPIPILHSAGCYWGKCSFCDYINLHEGKKYRPRPVEEIIADIRYYQRMNHANFRMIAEAIPPRHAYKIAQALLGLNLNVKWHAFLRVDEGFSTPILKAMTRSGFSGTIGMESANNRALKTLNKGYTRATIRNLFEKMRRASSTNHHLNIMVGVPGVSYADDLETYRFCEQYQDLFSRFKAGWFTLTATSDMGKNPQKYGLVVPEAQKRPHHGNGRITVLEFEDPDGMSLHEKQTISDLYRKLNRNRYRVDRFNGCYQRLMAARTGDALDGLTFSLPVEWLVRSGMAISPLSRAASNGGQRYYSIVNIAQDRDHQFFAPRQLADVMDSLAAGPFSFQDVARRTADDAQALDFLKQLARGAVLEVAHQ